MSALKRRALGISIHTGWGACVLVAKPGDPGTLDPSQVGKIVPPPWGKDQRLAALAAWATLGEGQ